MAEQEESFKVCGLCSQLVDEAVKLNDQLLTFLITFLEVPGTVLPTKICTECYQGAIDSKKFKEKCIRTVEKLKKTQISSNMILGRSHTDIKQMKQKFSYNNTDIDPLLLSSQKFKGSRGPKSSRPVLSPSSSVEDLPLSTRRSLGMDTTVPCSIVIPHTERVAADQMIERSRSGRVLKRNVTVLERDSSPVSKLPRHESKPHKKSKKRSSSGKGNVDQVTVIEGDDEEIFPSMGPYQCEICQEITDTKQEFVAHIKALHKDMVDEAVLRSLESDLKKRKKKELAATPIAKKPSKSVKKVATTAPKSSIGSAKINKTKRARPKKKYTEVDSGEEEYMPSMVKRAKRRENLSPEELKARNEPGECSICGTKMARSGDIPKHQESLRCRQVAFLASQQQKDQRKDMLKEQIVTIDDDIDPNKAVDEEVDPHEADDCDPNKGKGSPINVDMEVIEEKNDIENNEIIDHQNKDDGSIAVEEKENKNYGDDMEAQPGEGKSDNEDRTSPIDETKFNFKALIAKRYEAEKNDAPEHPSSEKDKIDINLLNANDYSLDQKIRSGESSSKTTKIESTTRPIANEYETMVNTGVGEQSPAAYIDPAPQPDVDLEPSSPHHRKSLKQPIVSCDLKEQKKLVTCDLGEQKQMGSSDPLDQKKMGTYDPKDQKQMGICDPRDQKDMVNCDLRDQKQMGTCDTRGDPAAEELASMGVRVPPLIHMGQPAMDSIDAQMAALHGAAGANTPWHEFHENYFGH